VTSRRISAEGAGAAAAAAADERVTRGAARVLEQAWQDDVGYCRPHRRNYPHLWMWDSCFHAIAWAALGDARALRELDSVFSGQRPDGFLPHMRYGRRTKPRGPIPGVSSFTQPPVYARALRAAAQAGLAPPAALIDRARRALESLWRDRLRDGLLVVVHPWETGLDDSPRWDSWVGASAWQRRRWTRSDAELVDATVFADDGRAVDSRRFVVASASFNAIAADAALLLGDLAADDAWRARGRELAAAVDARCWDPREAMWRDIDYLGDNDSVRTPTADGVLPALVTPNGERALAALSQLGEGGRFFAPYGPAFVPPSHPAYRPDRYWRGPAWPQLNYLYERAALAAGAGDLARDIAQRSRAAVLRARFSEYWNPENGKGLGARPQTWSAVVAAM
jgi:hypothetical protein